MQLNSQLYFQSKHDHSVIAPEEGVVVGEDVRLDDGVAVGLDDWAIVGPDDGGTVVPDDGVDDGACVGVDDGVEVVGVYWHPHG